MIRFKRLTADINYLCVHWMALKVYSEYCIDVLFDDGPLGFAPGSTEDGFSVISTFVKKDDGTILPLEVYM